MGVHENLSDIHTHYLSPKRGYLIKIQTFYGIQKFSKVIVPRIILKAKEAITVPRTPYTQMVKPEGGESIEKTL